MYKLTNSDTVIRLVDNAFIPKDESNGDYQDYLKWVVEGNTPQPVDLPTLAEIISGFEGAVQAHLDADAMSKGYDNINTACTYAGAPNPFELEAKQFVTWRGNVWAYCYGELAKVQGGLRPLPTIAQIISELPLKG